MTGEDLPAAEPETHSRPELRASDEERERVAEILRLAAGNGRLTLAEFDERLEAALMARTSGELAALAADLPEEGVGRTKEFVRLDVQGGHTARRGRWIVPKRMEIRGAGGAVKLDFTDAVITHPTLDIRAEIRGGRLVVVTRPGVEVDVDDVAAHGGRVKVRPVRGPQQPVLLMIRISGQAHGGDLIVRPQHRSFRRWARHRSRL